MKDAVQIKYQRRYKMAQYFAPPAILYFYNSIFLRMQQNSI